jgi:hypothetical protein
MRNPDPLGTSDGADLTSIGDHHHSWIQHNNHLPLSTPLPPTPPQQQQQQPPLALPLQPLPLPLPPPPLLPPQQPPPRSLESSLQHPSHDPPPTGHAPSPPRLAAPSQPGTVTDTLLGSPELLVLMNGQPHTPPTANSAMADSMHGQFKGLTRSSNPALELTQQQTRQARPPPSELDPNPCRQAMTLTPKAAPRQGQGQIPSGSNRTRIVSIKHATSYSRAWLTRFQSQPLLPRRSMSPTFLTMVSREACKSNAALVRPRSALTVPSRACTFCRRRKLVRFLPLRPLRPRAPFR